MRDYLMGEPRALRPEQMKDSNLLNPALMQEVTAQLLVTHPNKKEEILARLMALSEPVKESTRPVCQFGVERLTDRVDLVVSGTGSGTEAVFANATHCSPKHRRKPRTIQDVSVGEWVVLAIALALIVLIIVMLVFFYRPSRR